MNIEIKKMNKDLLEDHLLFFDQMKTIDSYDCSKCYCVFFHAPEKAREWLKRTDVENKNLAIRLINEEKLTGFLAYDRKRPIAWCNVNDKNAFNFNKSRFYVNKTNCKNTICIVCFYVNNNYRGKGLASSLLKYIIEYYRNSNYKYIEVYPSTNKTKESENYHGYPSLFLKNNFKIINEMNETDDLGDHETYAIMRFEF